jgi:hypothetical protein
MDTYIHQYMSQGLNSSILTNLHDFGRSFDIAQSTALFSKQHELIAQFRPLTDGLDAFYGFSPVQIVVFVLCVAWALGPVISKPPAVTNAVYHGYRSWLEPTWLLRARFILNSQSLISSGSLKVCMH